MIQVTDAAFVRFCAPDLDRMEQFLGDFGLVTARRDENLLYSRGSDPEPWIHVVEKGEAGFAGVGFDAASAEDLEAAAGLPGASALEELDGPGGGRRVRLSDPDGFSVEVVHGREPAGVLPAPHAQAYNTGQERRRINVLQRVERGPSRVKRLGHCVLRVSDFRTSEDWYRSRLGFLRSDEVYLGEPDNVITAFLRCDRGDVPVDHHTFLCVGVGEPGFDHAAFEVEDIDAVMLGHEHLQGAGYDHHAGIGRHILGSQVFDYWRDPWGHVLEHFTDGDLLDAGVKGGRFEPAAALGTQWGKFGSEA
jgi:catechol 2,3-dioxygenase-like lactoylglutathione lyase family enzyme